MNIVYVSCACGRPMPSTVALCEQCDAARVAGIQRIHERTRKAPIGVMTYQPSERAIIESINANAARARVSTRTRHGRAAGLLWVLGATGVFWGCMFLLVQEIARALGGMR